jgi:nucleoside-diphosphate-sugar epimerase
MTRVLVTGATGFIGRHTLAPLLEANHEVHAVTSRDAPRAEAGVKWHRADLFESAGVVREVSPEVLLHLAWYVEHGRFWTSPLNVRWVEASLALLRAFADGHGRRAVLAGTSAEYDWEAAGDRCREELTPLRPATLYGAAKHALHRVAERYAEQAGFELAWGRIFSVYGPGEPDGRLVPSVGRALLAGEPVLTTRGDHARDFMHVEDVGAAFAALAGSGTTGAVNVASGEPMTVQSVVDELADAVGRQDLLRPGALPEREGDPPRLVADVTRLREEVGFTPRIGMAEGLRGTLEWLRTSPSPPSGDVIRR